jgi:hypothetical protein
VVGLRECQPLDGCWLWPACPNAAFGEAVTLARCPLTAKSGHSASLVSQPVRHLSKLPGAKSCMVRLTRDAEGGLRRAVGDIEHRSAILFSKRQPCSLREDERLLRCRVVARHPFRWRVEFCQEIAICRVEVRVGRSSIFAGCHVIRRADTFLCIAVPADADKSEEE